MINKTGDKSLNKKKTKVAKKRKADTSQSLLSAKKKVKKTVKKNLEIKVPTSLKKHTTKQRDTKKEKYLSILNNINDGCIETDLTGNVTFINDPVCRIFGYSRRELLGSNYRHYMDKKTAKKVFAAYNKVYRTGNPLKGFNWETTRKDGVKRQIETSISLQKDSTGKPIGFTGIVNDITDRKQAEDALRKKTEELDRYFTTSLDLLCIADIDGYFRRLNPEWERTLGYPLTELVGKQFLDFVHPDDLEATFDAMSQLERREEVLNFENRYRCKDNSYRWIEWRSYPQEKLIYAVARDITERKRIEYMLKESENKYRLLAENIQDVVFVMDMNLNYTYLSPSVKLLRGYEPEEAMKHTPEETVTPASMDLALGILSEMLELEKSEQRDVNISRTAQLEMTRKDGTTVWVETKAFFMRDENLKPISIMGVTRDINERKKAEEKLKQTLESLRKAVGTTIQVLVSAVESRDSYTAGHQSRAANLACAIATEMGLSEEKIEGLRMAGSIHDIGKLSIPAEILSKPTKLTELEFTLIKEHAQSGYEMLKDVESPWPLAEIVYQHHERINGSGYPRNLKGDEIIMESRILAVADVVEAMASHRPYRAALGIEAALEEITKNRGILYDITVVDACLKLFREKGYQLI